MTTPHTKKCITSPKLRVRNSEVSSHLQLPSNSLVSSSLTSNTLEARALQALNVLKFLSLPKQGCNRNFLLPLHFTLVRSILDYGYSIHALVPTFPSHLKLLDPIQNSAIRIINGVFRINPAVDLSADSGVPPLQYRL